MIYKYWHKTKNLLNFSILVLRYLAIPGTSVLSERIFSTAGVLVNKLRSCMSSSVIDQIKYECNNENI